MKTSQRHHLKSNDFAESLLRARDALVDRQREVAIVLVALAVVIVAVVGYLLWSERRSTAAEAALGAAMSTAVAPVTPPDTATPVPPAGGFATEEQRNEAALQQLLDVANTYGSTRAGVAARYQAAGLLAELGRDEEAEREFGTVVESGRGIYARMARLGMAEAQLRTGQHEAAITTFRELVADRQADLPPDGLLMQLGRAYALAGRRAEALQTYSRVLEEHPESIYVAEARREVETLKAGPAGESS
jgi:hypothetical protein